MAGCVDHGDRVRAEAQSLGVLKIGVRAERKSWGIQRMNQYGRPGDPFEFSSAPSVIHVAMGDEDIANLQTQARDLLDNAKHLISRVDDHPFISLTITQYVTVGLIGTNDKFSQHG